MIDEGKPFLQNLLVPPSASRFWKTPTYRHTAGEGIILGEQSIVSTCSHERTPSPMISAEVRPGPYNRSKKQRGELPAFLRLGQGTPTMRKPKSSTKSGRLALPSILGRTHGHQALCRLGGGFYLVGFRVPCFFFKRSGSKLRLWRAEGSNFEFEFGVQVSHLERKQGRERGCFAEEQGEVGCWVDSLTPAGVAIGRENTGGSQCRRVYSRFRLPCPALSIV